MPKPADEELEPAYAVHWPSRTSSLETTVWPPCPKRRRDERAGAGPGTSGSSGGCGPPNQPPSRNPADTCVSWPPTSGPPCTWPKPWKTSGTTPTKRCGFTCHRRAAPRSIQGPTSVLVGDPRGLGGTEREL